ncbi:MAG: hypothetical protein SGI92_31390 [Bryobacteraceae bacterium]|nr:hypothetical protein [Bryobacteraceae bacterium]
MSNQQFDPEMRGVVFPNDKAGNERRPDWRGHVVINGVKYWLSMWDGFSQDKNQEYKNIKVERAEDRPQAEQQRPRESPQPAAKVAQRPTTIAELDDDIPF